MGKCVLRLRWRTTSDRLQNPVERVDGAIESVLDRVSSATARRLDVGTTMPRADGAGKLMSGRVGKGGTAVVLLDETTGLAARGAKE